MAVDKQSVLAASRNVKNNEKQYRTVFRFFAASLVASAQAKVHASPESVAALKAILYKPISDSDSIIFDSYGGPNAGKGLMLELANPSDPLIHRLASDPKALALLINMYRESTVLSENVYQSVAYTNFDSPAGLSISLAAHVISHIQNAITRVITSIGEISSAEKELSPAEAGRGKN